MLRGEWDCVGVTGKKAAKRPFVRPKFVSVTLEVSQPTDIADTCDIEL